jgi:stage V sporulation protein SpoVS
VKKIGVAFFCLLLLVFCVGSVSAAASPDYVPGEVLVLLREAPSANIQANGVSFEAALAAQASAFAESVGAQAVRTYSSLAATTGKSIVLLRSDTKSTEELLAAVEENDAVLGASPNYIVHASAVPTIYFTASFGEWRVSVHLRRGMPRREAMPSTWR